MSNMNGREKRNPQHSSLASALDRHVPRLSVNLNLSKKGMIQRAHHQVTQVKPNPWTSFLEHPLQNYQDELQILGIRA
jgi:hypothetical protein